MKVLHIETGRHLYGGARQVLYLLDGLAASETQNTLVCPTGSAIEAAVRPDVARVIALPLKGDLDIGAVARLRRVIRSEAPDIVHLHSRRGADTFGALASIGLDPAVVLSRRVDNRESSLAIALKYRLMDRVITISQAICDVLRSQGVPTEKLVCVPSAVDIDEWLQPAPRASLLAEFSLPEDACVVGMAAQFIRRKGHDVLIEALRRLVDPLPTIHLLLFGKGPLQESIQHAVANEGLTRNVTFAGYRDDLPRWLGALDLMVHPARAEGLGVALLQGAAAGLGLVACAAGGIPEIVIDGRTGWLVPPDEPAALAGALLAALTDDESRHARARAARQHVAERFSIAAMAQGNLAVYQSLLQLPR